MKGLAITRKIDQAVVIETPAGSIRVMVTEVVSRQKVKLLIDAPRSWPVWREELIDGCVDGSEANRKQHPGA